MIGVILSDQRLSMVDPFVEQQSVGRNLDDDIMRTVWLRTSSMECGSDHLTSIKGSCAHDLIHQDNPLNMYHVVVLQRVVIFQKF